MLFSEVIFLQFLNIKSQEDLQKLAERFEGLDYIITAKFLNELLPQMPDPYRTFADSFSRSLADDGLMLMVDVACPRDTCFGQNQYVAEIMHSQLNEFISKNGFRDLLPPPPAKYYHPACPFSYIENGEEKSGTSKYTYRVIAENELCNLVASKRSRSRG